MNQETEQSRNKTSGVIYGALSFTLWGLLPLYWKLLKQIPADEILSHRIIWSFVFVIGILLFTQKTGVFVKYLTDKRVLLRMSLCSLMIGINWFIYIWAVNNNHIIETSMGYYINPLISVALGLFVLKEKMKGHQYAALALAAVAVSIIILQYGRVPWIALSLAVSFALYGLLKKVITIESAVGLAMETAVLTPAAFIYVVFKEINGSGSLTRLELPTMLLLLCAGVATATPLLLFAKGTKRVELSTIGFLQYISPSITLTLGVFVFHEEFTKTHMISFGLIWLALLVYSLPNLLIKKGLVTNPLIKEKMSEEI
ncbi:MAG: EamA family transporter RarD [Clostridia bacterium]|nr:EamA family transporter RarD [Clostridia bacterium]